MTIEERSWPNFANLLESKTTETKINPEYKKKLLTHYLNLTVPEWRSMIESGRLYVHLQHMLENTEGIRRFEIEMLWKRSAYMISIMFIFFAAFGALALSDSNDVAGMPKNFILLSLAIINAYLSFCFVRTNHESRKWQRNWEYHADYLHELLDTRLMSVFFCRKAKYFTIGKINIAIGVLMLLIWICIPGFLLYIGSCTERLSYIAAIVLFLLIMFAIHKIISLVKIGSEKVELESYQFSDKIRD